MLYKQIKYFISVVECNSFTEAAEINFISQSAISQQIQALEEEIGVPLILRKNRKFELTPAGEYFYINSREVLNEVKEIRRETVRIGQLGQDNDLTLKVGYLNYYNGEELYQTIAEFTQIYPEVNVELVKGTHEELRDLLKYGDVDLILMEQRRVFSDQYVNFQLRKCDCYIEVSNISKISSYDKVTIDDLKRIPCILISSKEQRLNEQDFYKNILGFRGRFIFGESLEAGRLMVVGNRGFMPIEIIGTLVPPSSTVKRIPLYRGDTIMQRNYCAFWEKGKANKYNDKFAKILHKLLNKK